MGKIINKYDRIGETSISKEGYEMKIIEYIDARHILIEFQDEHKTRLMCQYGDFKRRKNIKNPYHPSVYKIGYLGQGKYNKKNYQRIYWTWKDMLRRCYSEEYLKREPSYRGCCVCEEWHNFQNFAKWYEENYYEVENQRMHLDKDILVKMNKTYSPQTCIFVPQIINSLFITSKAIRGEYPIGVSRKQNKLIVQINKYDENTKKSKYTMVKKFEIEEVNEAFFCYKTEKENEIKRRADLFKEYIPKKLYNALYKYKIEITD